MGGKQSSNSNPSRHVDRHGPSGPLTVGNGSSSSGSSRNNRSRSRTLNELLADSSPLTVPHGLFAARYASEMGLSSVSPELRGGRRRRRRNRDDSGETNSLPSQLFSSLLSGG